MERTFTRYITTDAGEQLPVTVTRKRVHNFNLRVHDDARVTLSVPERCAIDSIDSFLAHRSEWIQGHVKRRLMQIDEQSRLRAQQGYPLWGALVRSLPEDPSERLAAYRHEVKSRLPKIAKPFEDIMGVHATGWSVRTMKTRWGSCTPKTGSIRINASLAAYPPLCLEYVVAHELTHLMEASHNQRFHMLLHTYFPDEQKARALLAQTPEAVAAGHIAAGCAADELRAVERLGR